MYSRNFKLTGALVLLAGLALYFFRPQSEPSPDDPIGPSASNPGTESVSPVAPEPVSGLDSGSEWVGERAPGGFSVQPLNADGSLDIRLETPGFVARKSGDGVVLELEGQAGPLAQGAPELPSLVKVLDGTPGFSATVDVVENDFVDLPGYQVAARAAFHPVIENGDIARRLARIENPSVYETDAWYPAEPVSVEEAYQGDRKFYRVRYNPLQYNPVTGTLRHHRSLETRVRLVPEGSLEISALSGAVPVTESDCDCSLREETPGEIFPEVTGIPEDFIVCRSGSEVDACVKITTQGQGLYRMTRGALVAAGVDPAVLVGDELRIFHRDREVSTVVTQTGLWSDNAAHAILFYAEPFKGTHSNENVYWLGFGGLRKAMVTRDGTPHVSGAVLVTDACRKVVVESRNSYEPTENISDPRFDGWFMGRFGAPSNILAPVPFTITGTDHAAGSPAIISALVRGITSVTTVDPDHNAIFRVQSSLAGVMQYQYDGREYFEAANSFPPTVFTGASTVFEVLEVDPGPFGIAASWLDRITMFWDRNLHLISGNLAFQGPAGVNNYDIGSVRTSAGNFILDVSDPFEPCLMTGATTVPEGGGTFRLSFGDTSGDPVCFFVADGSALINVASADVSIIEDRGLADPTRQADYIVILGEGFPINAYKHLKYRAENGREVLVAPVDDIYNEFGFGLRDPNAIRNFIGYAFHHYQAPAPQYVVLVGDASFDPIGAPANDLVPTPFGVTSDQWTALDTWYGAINGADTLIDVAIGRMPVNNEAELARMVNKIQAYEAAVVTSPAWTKAAHFVADDDDNAENFKGSMEIIRNSVFPASFTTKTTGYVTDVSPGAVRNSILNAFGGGRYSMSYFGHGAFDQWAAEDVWSNTDANGLSNGIFPIVGIFTCANGIYHTPPDTCTVEVMVRKANSGAIACLAPTGFAQSLISFRMAVEFYNALLNDQFVTGYTSPNFTYETRAEKTLGKSYMNGLAAIWFFSGNSTSEVKFYNLFGDPALVIKP